MTRKSWKALWVALGFGWGLVLAGVPRATGAEKLVLLLDWVPYAAHLGMYAALDRGDYRRAGLSVEITRGFGSGDTIKRVGVGSAQMGFADAGSLVVARAQGIQTKVVGMILDKSMFVVTTLKKSGIRTAKDLEGRKVATPKTSSTYILFPALAALNGVDTGKIEFVFMGAAALGPSLMAGKVDAILNYDNSTPTFVEAARKAHQEAAVFLYSKWGLDIYSNGLITSDALIQDKPAVAGSFVRSTMEGTAWAVEHPEEAADIFVKLNPTQDPVLTRKAWAIVVDHLLTPTARKLGLGHMDRKKMELTRDVVTKYMKLPVTVPVEEIYTNRFLPKLFPKPPGS